jgi:hypothetical protein
MLLDLHVKYDSGQLLLMMMMLLQPMANKKGTTHFCYSLAVILMRTTTLSSFLAIKVVLKISLIISYNNSNAKFNLILISWPQPNSSQVGWLQLFVLWLSFHWGQHFPLKRIFLKSKRD